MTEIPEANYSDVDFYTLQSVPAPCDPPNNSPNPPTVTLHFGKVNVFSLLAHRGGHYAILFAWATLKLPGIGGSVINYQCNRRTLTVPRARP